MTHRGPFQPLLFCDSVNTLSLLLHVIYTLHPMFHLNTPGLKDWGGGFMNLVIDAEQEAVCRGSWSSGSPHPPRAEAPVLTGAELWFAESCHWV